MEIKGMPADNFAVIVRRIGAEFYADNLTLDYTPNVLNRTGTRFRVRMRAISSRAPGARRSWSGRRSVAACWHAFRDVYAEVFRVYPDAVITTGMARYVGAAGFERDYPATGERNIGSMVAQAYMPDLCDCDSADDDIQRPQCAGDWSMRRPVAPAPAPVAPTVLDRIAEAIREAERSTPYTGGSDSYSFRGADMDTAPSVR